MINFTSKLRPISLLIIHNIIIYYPVSIVYIFYTYIIKTNNFCKEKAQKRHFRFFLHFGYPYIISICKKLSN